MKFLLTALVCVCILSSCSKSGQPEVNAASEFIQYNIAAGDHYCDKSTTKSLNITRQVFQVIFDSSAIYTTAIPENQYDINKLYGFTEGTDPHLNSARVGWSYNNDSLRIYAYAYKNGERLRQEICTVNIGDTINCSISLNSVSYIFSVNNKTVQLDRGLHSGTASGYQLYPYFGGDETAPHRIRICIRDIASGK